MKRILAAGLMLCLTFLLLFCPPVSATVGEPARAVAGWVREKVGVSGGEVEEPETAAELSGAEAVETIETAVRSLPVQTAEDTEPAAVSPEPTEGTEDPAAEIQDLPEDPSAAAAVRYVHGLGLLNGYSGGAFRPDGFLTRGQALTALRRLAALSCKQGAEATDTDWAVSAGILQSSGGNNAAQVTRGQFAAFLYRLAGYMGRDTDCSGNLSAYHDGKAVPEYARIPLSWAMEHGIYAVLVEDALSPQVPVSRSQAAQVLTAWLAPQDSEAASITAAAWNPAFRSASRAKHTELAAAIEQVRKRYGAVGIQVAVIEAGHLTDVYGSGWSIKDRLYMGPENQIRCASLSKVVIGVLAVRMAQEGEIDLDAPIGTYWGEDYRNPWFPDRPVTIHTILNHTSTITGPETGGLTDAARVRALLRSKSGYTANPPGENDSWTYSNYAFGVLGMTLERAENRNMDELLQRYFFRAMNIDAAFTPADLSDSSLLASLYDAAGKATHSAQYQKQNIPAKWNPGTRGADFPGGLLINVWDLGKIAAMLANDGNYEGLQLLSPESVEVIEERGGWAPDGFRQCFPLRWQGGVYGRESLYYHTGSAYGVYSAFTYDPGTKDGVVVITTGANSGARDNGGNYTVCGELLDTFYRAIAR